MNIAVFVSTDVRNLDTALHNRVHNRTMLCASKEATGYNSTNKSCAHGVIYCFTVATLLLLYVKFWLLTCWSGNPGVDYDLLFIFKF